MWNFVVRCPNGSEIRRVANRYATTRSLCPLRVKGRRTQLEHMFSGLPPKADIGDQRPPPGCRSSCPRPSNLRSPAAGGNSLQVQPSAPSSNCRLSVIEPWHAVTRNSAASERSVRARHSPTEAGVEQNLLDAANGSDLWRADQPSRCPGVRPQQRREPVKPFRILTAAAVLAAPPISPASP